MRYRSFSHGGVDVNGHFAKSVKQEYFFDMAPIKLGNMSVEIAVNAIDGFIHDLIEVPVKNGFWVVFTVKDQSGKTESFPLVDENHRIEIYQSYPEALHQAAQKLMRPGMEPPARM